MPFVKVDIKKEIEEQCNNDPEFKEKWEKSRQEYKVLGEIVKLRKKWD